jgi:hypothetical protein
VFEGHSFIAIYCLPQVQCMDASKSLSHGQ